MPFPPLTNATTADAIRDRAIVLVEAIAPTIAPATNFRAFRNEGSADFLAWCEANPESAFRRFQVRTSGRNLPPEVSNTDHEERIVALETIVAYPHNARAGARQALDRDTAMDRDYDALELAIGLYSRANFSAPHPDACWFDGEANRLVGDRVDFLVVSNSYSFRRSLFT